ncbi:MAG: response regulator transcription factor [Bacteroidales bacterium]|jgi:DNA-binding response OmpR family regulator|nr:response regulator transcription factor [Bacteroidales bacterium]
MKRPEVSILLAEDDPNLGTFLKNYLSAKGFPTMLCVNGEDVLHAYHDGRFNFVILDIMIPLIDGLTVAKEIRKIDEEIPIIFTSAKHLEADRMQGLAIGADDYIVKPFNMDELLLRINAILRRTRVSVCEKMRKYFDLGELTFDTDKMVLYNENERIVLTSKESDLLRLFCTKENQLISRSYVLSRIWNSDNFFSSRSMDVYISKLRRHLRPFPHIRIHNAHGVGFKLIVNR